MSISLNLSEEQQILRDTAHDFATNEIRSAAMHRSITSSRPEAISKKAAERGLVSAKRMRNPSGMEWPGAAEAKRPRADVIATESTAAASALSAEYSFEKRMRAAKIFCRDQGSSSLQQVLSARASRVRGR